jgi:hypothetical protein
MGNAPCRDSLTQLASEVETVQLTPNLSLNRTARRPLGAD